MSRFGDLGDRGTTLLLQVYLVVVVVLAITLLADVAAAVSARHRLAATADQAAVAGSAALDLGTYYATGLRGELRLDQAGAAAAVRRYLAPAIAADQHRDLAVREVRVGADTITVRLSCRAELPFTAAFGIESVPISATASARLRPRG